MQEGQLFALMCNLEAIAPFRLLAIMGLRRPRAKNAKAFGACLVGKKAKKKVYTVFVTSNL
jgi:hypothetical protein